MAVTKYKPLTPAKRGSSRVKKEEITKKKPERSLVVTKTKSGGRNNYGRVTIRHRGGGSKQKLRVIDFKRRTEGMAEVLAIEYDPNRSANIALLRYSNGKKAYIIHPQGLSVGDKVSNGEDAPLEIGNAKSMKYIPEGIPIHNIEINPGQGAIMARSAGAEAVITAKEDKTVLLKFPSGEVRRVNNECYATIGKVGNMDHEKVNLGFAGASRHRGRRPRVRGVAMNACDHPHGGGRGKSKGNNKPSNPWGKRCKGVKTRKQNKPSDKLIIRRRKK